MVEFDPYEALQTIEELDGQVREYFGYVERWTYLPLEDMTDSKWSVHGSSVVWCDEDDNLEKGILNGEVSYYVGHVVDQPLEKDEYTLIGVALMSDGNQSLMMFRSQNKIELSEDALECL